MVVLSAPHPVLHGACIASGRTAVWTRRQSPQTEACSLLRIIFRNVGLGRMKKLGAPPKLPCCPEGRGGRRIFILGRGGVPLAQVSKSPRVLPSRDVPLVTLYVFGRPLSPGPWLRWGCCLGSETPRTRGEGSSPGPGLSAPPACSPAVCPPLHPVAIQLLTDLLWGPHPRVYIS